MYLNDQLGCCVEAAAAHMIQQWNFYAGHPAKPTDQDVLSAYEAVGGYVPGDPNSDNGTDMLAFLNWWRQTGSICRPLEKRLLTVAWREL